MPILHCAENLENSLRFLNASFRDGQVEGNDPYLPKCYDTRLEPKIIVNWVRRAVVVRLGLMASSRTQRKTGTKGNR